MAVEVESKKVDAKMVDPKIGGPNPIDPKGVDPKKKKSAAAQLKSVWPMIGELVRPRRGLLAFSFLLLLIGRLCGLVLPAAPKYLLDDVIGKHRAGVLLPLVLVVLGATLIQGLTSFALTQLLSKEGQRLISELRKRVQTHVGRLSLNYYDANKTGALVSRIMSDVEGIRNLIGTGLVEFFGGVLTAVLSLGFLLKYNAEMTGIAIGFLVVLMVALSRAFKTIRPIFRERAKINAEVTGRLTESLGGVRVVKGYHAEERESNVFGRGVQRLLDNVLKSLTATSLMGLTSTVVLGVVSAIIMFIGARQILAGHMTAGQLFSYTMFMGFLIAPVAQMASIGTQITEALAGLDRTREVLEERREDQDPERSIVLGHINGAITFENVDFSYEPGKPVLDDVSFDAQPGTVTALVGSSGSGKSTIIGLAAAFYKPTSGRVTVD
ncbi:MAG TPA: ABC transporter ATP-binding protein, partial [Candidatus Limnocylindrales bacterium]|nr:ABC transporter ATP-binding protein [Candidatus Limnocylindrales bacterium]